MAAKFSAKVHFERRVFSFNLLTNGDIPEREIKKTRRSIHGAPE